MDAKLIIDNYKSMIIQIATPYSTGTGFYLSSHNLIITNEHVVRDNQEVVINGLDIKKQLSKVIFLDEKHDLAFLQGPSPDSIPDVSLGRELIDLDEGEDVLALGHPFGLQYSATQGIISNTFYEVGGILYLQHDAALNPGNSGGPLISEKGMIIGVNTFIVKNGNNVGLSLPVNYLKDALDAFERGNGEFGIRCSSCMNPVFESTKEGKYCPNCGSEVSMISTIDKYEPSGIGSTLEKMITELGYDVVLSRTGPNNWTVTEGSAKINITYHEKTGLITGDAYLASLPDVNIKDVYIFLLSENYKLQGLTLSVKDQNIILSLLIFDQYFNQKTAKTLFQNLKKTADDIDNVLVEKYGAKWITKL